MSITLTDVENLAPDQSSINAAKKLLKPAKWVLKNSNNALVWAHCQGSGANPYKTVIDISDHGYKCTCPSRKFPCKHSLALMWMYAESSDTTNEYPHDDEIPQWINDWISRRRPATKTAEDEQDENNEARTDKNIHLATTEAAPVDREAEQKKAQAAAKRQLKTRQTTDATINQGISDYEQWLADQLRHGLGKFLDNVHNNCRKISARMVDAKATTLASRLDELPAKILAAHKDMRLRVLTNELSKTVWLIKAWQKHSAHINDTTSLLDDLYKDINYVDVRRAINSYESRDKLLENESTIKQKGLWQVVAEHIETRKDGLISHATWLMYLGRQSAACDKENSSDECDNELNFALLQDYYPMATGRREGATKIGEILQATAVFYPSKFPLRAVLTQQETLKPAQFNELLNDINTELVDCPQPQSMAEFTALYQHALSVAPWLETMPVCLPKGRFVVDINHQAGGSTNIRRKKNDPLKHIWWQSDDGSWQIPLLPNQSISDSSWALLLSSESDRSVIFWDGVYARYGSSETPWGMM